MIKERSIKYLDSEYGIIRTFLIWEKKTMWFLKYLKN